MSSNTNLALAGEPETTGSATDATLDAIQFECGLFGFPECRSFSLLATGRAGLYWLQSDEHKALRLLLADPFLFFPGYAVDLPRLDAARLHVKEVGDVAVLVTVTLPDTPGRGAAANLQGPIAINVRTRQGRQVILNDPAWGVREPIDLGLAGG